MSRKRAGWRSTERTYNYLTNQLRNKAAEEKAGNKYRQALALCLQEIEQFHSTAYPGCKGGCPAHEAMEAARALISH